MKAASVASGWRRHSDHGEGTPEREARIANFTESQAIIALRANGRIVVSDVVAGLVVLSRRDALLTVPLVYELSCRQCSEEVL